MRDVFKFFVNACYAIPTTQHNAANVFCKLEKLPEINAGHVFYDPLTKTTAAVNYNCH